MGRPTILLVEDNAITRKMLRVALEAEDYAVIEAEDGSTALACIREKRPDLIIQDIILPDADGLELTSRIRALPHGVDVPIMVLSGFVGRVEVARAVTDRYVAFLVKPMAPSRLVAAVREHMPLSRTERRNQGVPAGSAPMPVLPGDERAQRAVQQEQQAARLILLEERCTRQAAELSLLGGIADALTRSSDADMELTLRDIFTATLDAAGISTGALYLVLNGAEEVSLRQALGFASSARVEDFFGQFSVLTGILAGKFPVTLPSAAIPESISRSILAQAEMASLQVVPLIFDGKAVGALALGSRAVDLPSEGVVAFARAIGAQIVQSLAFIRAFDQRKAAEASLRQANAELEEKVVARTRELSEANAALQRTARTRQDMVAIVSHDLRNPLSTIALAVAQMGRCAGVSAVPELTIARIGRAAAQMEHLIGGLLDCASIEEGSFAVTREPVSVRRLLDEVVETHLPLLDAKSLRLEVVGPVDNGFISGDSARLLQVFSNLIGNAIKFTQARGLITLAATQEAEGWKLSVTDSGCGIDPEHMPHIFDRYWQGKDTAGHGIGLGLAIVKGIVEVHGGRLWVESKVGKGTTFLFALPVWTAPVPMATAQKASVCTAVEVMLNPRTVLVVDDDCDLRGSVAALLSEAGYQVLEASDGQAALAAIAGATSVHVIVLDQQMPGMNGAAFLRERELRASVMRIPVLMVSGSGVDVMPGVAELIRKPFTQAMLLESVRRHCVTTN